MFVLMASVGSVSKTLGVESGVKNFFAAISTGFSSPFEITIEPAQHGELQFRHFIMHAGREREAEFVGRVVKLVNAPDFFVDAHGVVEMEKLDRGPCRR